jgi:hypothetical protein
LVDELVFAFTLCWIYSCEASFCFFSFFLGYPFLLGNFLFWFAPFQWGSSQLAGFSHVWVDLIMTSVSTVAHLECSAHLDMFNNQRIDIYTLKFSTTFCILKACAGNKIQYSFWATKRISNTTVWPWHTHQLHHCNIGMKHIASLNWHLSDTWWFGGVHTLDGLGSFLGVLNVNTKIWTS